MGIVNLIITGDIFPKKNESLFIEGKKERLFDQSILDLLENADFSVCNLEGALTRSDNAIPKRGLHLKASPECITAIKEAGIGYVSLANNHSPDFGTEGIKETIQTLENNVLSHFGAGFTENYKKYI